MRWKRINRCPQRFGQKTPTAHASVISPALAHRAAENVLATVQATIKNTEALIARTCSIARSRDAITSDLVIDYQFSHSARTAWADALTTATPTSPQH